MSSTDSVRELGRRQSDGLEVRLLWYAGRRRLTIEVYDDLSGQMFEFDVAPQCADDALHHPYAYAPTEIVLRAAARRLVWGGSSAAGRCAERRRRVAARAIPADA